MPDLEAVKPFVAGHLPRRCMPEDAAVSATHDLASGNNRHRFMKIILRRMFVTDRSPITGSPSQFLTTGCIAEDGCLCHVCLERGPRRRQ